MAKYILRDSGVEFSEENHTYTLNGKRLKGLTELIHHQLYPNEFNDIPEETLQLASQYGTATHKSIEYFINEFLDNGSQELKDFLMLSSKNGLLAEIAEYNVSDFTNYASNIDVVFRENDTTFSLCDIKTYSVLDSKAIEKTRWQLSLLSVLFEKTNPKAKVGRLLILHLRNKINSNGETDHAAEIVEVQRIPAEVCLDLLQADLEGRQFQNPYSIPEQLKQQETEIRELMLTKAKTEERLNAIKAEIFKEMTEKGVRNWSTDTMRLTLKRGGTRTTFNASRFKQDHPELDYSAYETTSQISDSLQITL